MQIKIYRSWAEFKKSHLIRVATLYAITGWMVLEFVIQVFPIFSIPDWVITSMTAIVILGLPFAIIIAVASDRKSGEQKKIIDESEVRISLHANKVSLHEKSIAVLPFINLSSDKENEFFTDGISEEINNVLTQIPGLKVAGRTSSFSYKNKTGDLRNIGSELNVKTILEGSVRRSGNRLRVTAQLIEADSGFHMWSRNFDRELSDIFVIQDEIANEIASKLELSLTQETQRTQTRDVTAYQSYLKGRSLYYQRGTSLFEALKCFENALEIDPQYALAFSGLADTYVMLNFHGYLSPRETWEKAIEASNNALKYGPNVAEAYNSNAIISLYHFRTWDKAGSEFQKALELNPSYMQARLWHALFYKFIIKNDVSDSIRLTELAIDSDPLSAYSRSILALICANIGLYDRAITESNKAVEIDPNSYLSHYVMAYSYQISGNYQEAVTCYNQSLTISNDHMWSLVGLVNTFLAIEKKELAQDIYEKMKSLRKNRYIMPSAMAICSASLGLKKEAIFYANEALDMSDPFLISRATNFKDASSLRAIPDFHQIKSRLGLT